MHPNPVLDINLPYMLMIDSHRGLNATVSRSRMVNKGSTNQDRSPTTGELEHEVMEPF